jgi:thiol-disulfide isomerase/thioredoxin
MEFLNLNGEEKMVLERIEGKKVVFFTSLYCLYCIDLLPHLNDIMKLSPDFSLILFSDGSVSEIADMINYFNWKFPVISFEEQVINRYLAGIKYPFMIVLNENNDLLTKGTIYNKIDFQLATKNIISIQS